MTSLAYSGSAYGQSIRRYRRIGLMMIGLFGAGFIAWGTLAPLSSAVIASGRFEVTDSVKKIQHPTGGTIAAIHVHDGDRVIENQSLISLDATTAKANLDIVESKLDELWMTAARLRAERDGLGALALPAYFAGRENEIEVVALRAAEERLFAIRTASRTGQKDQLAKRVEQLESQISGLKTQQQAKQTELTLATTELDRAQALLRQDVIAQSRVGEIQSGVARLQGELGQIVASIAELGGKIAETRLQAISIDQTAVADSASQLSDTERGISEFTERRVAASDQLARTEIRSPVDGIVHQLAVHTIGGVVNPGDVMMIVVPSGEALEIEARISPQDVDAVRQGETATIRLSGLNHATTPDLEASVTLVGADLVQDPLSRASYYPVTLSLKPGQLERLEGIDLLPGMPAEAFITTSERSFFDYLAQPIRERMSHALRE
jgi:HlyD family secretion protein